MTTQEASDCGARVGAWICGECRKDNKVFRYTIISLALEWIERDCRPDVHRYQKLVWKPKWKCIAYTDWSPLHRIRGTVAANSNSRFFRRDGCLLQSFACQTANMFWLDQITWLLAARSAELFFQLHWIRPGEFRWIHLKGVGSLTCKRLEDDTQTLSKKHNATLYSSRIRQQMLNVERLSVDGHYVMRALISTIYLHLAVIYLCPSTRSVAHIWPRKGHGMMNLSKETDARARPCIIDYVIRDAAVLPLDPLNWISVTNTP